MQPASSTDTPKFSTEGFDADSPVLGNTDAIRDLLHNSSEFRHSCKSPSGPRRLSNTRQVSWLSLIVECKMRNTSM